MLMDNSVQNDAEEISLRELVQKLRNIWKFLLSHWFKILIAGILGGGLGLGYAFFKPIKYTSRLTFVVEDAKSSVGGLASLAGQFGFDLGGAGGGGIFSGDNVLLFLKSEGLIRETLLTFYDGKGKETLADRYATASELKEDWLDDDEIGPIDFSKFSKGVLPRLEDSLLQEMITEILKSDLTVAKPDKKASFIEVKVVTRDEMLSSLFTERLVKIATDRYVESKTKTKVINVAKLQAKADSLAAVLNNKTYAAGSSQQTLVDINPALRTAPIAYEISTREKTMAATIFAEVIKNLEVSKTILNQETPIIQMVDKSTFPLQQEKVGKLKSLFIGGFLAAVLFVVYLLLQKWIKAKL
jgi:hypothetical protein